MSSSLHVTNKCPLLPYSQLVWETEQQMPGVYDIPLACHFNLNDIDIHRLHTAIEKAINNHPVFADLGAHYFAYKLSQDADIGHFRCTINRILGDWFSLGILLQDVIRAYQGQPLPQDHYVDYVQQFVQHKHSQRYNEHKRLLEEKFHNLTCPLRPTLDYPIQIADQWLLGEYNIPIDIPKTFSINNRLASITELVNLATAIAIMDYCNTDQTAITWAYLGRETEDELHIFGSLHRDVPMLISRCASLEEYWQQVRHEMRFGIQTSDYPLTLTHPHTDRWNYAVNVIEKPNILVALTDFQSMIYWDKVDPHPSPMAYSLLDIEIEESQLVFKYSATHYKPENITRFAAMVLDNMNQLRKNITL